MSTCWPAISSALVLLFLAAGPAYAAQEGGESRSVPAKLDAIQSTVDSIQSTVDLINPLLIQPVTLATGQVSFNQSIEDFGQGRLLLLVCKATNVGAVPITVRITVFSASDGSEAHSAEVSLQPRSGDAVSIIGPGSDGASPIGDYWCGFTFVGPSNAVRGPLELDDLTNVRILAVTDAR